MHKSDLVEMSWVKCKKEAQGIQKGQKWMLHLELGLQRHFWLSWTPKKIIVAPKRLKNAHENSVIIDQVFFFFSD